jgi:hypothetical protein
MDPEIGVVAGAVIALTAILTTGGVILLWPIARQLGGYLRALTEERKALPRPGEPPAERVVLVLERLDERLRVLEERQEFTEELLRSRQPGQTLSPPKGDGA